jgi:hypothetical protein
MIYPSILERTYQNHRPFVEQLQRLRYPCGTANPLFNSVMPILYVPD